MKICHERARTHTHGHTSTKPLMPRLMWLHKNGPCHAKYSQVTPCAGCSPTHGSLSQTSRGSCAGAGGFTLRPPTLACQRSRARRDRRRSSRARARTERCHQQWDTNSCDRASHTHRARVGCENQNKSRSRRKVSHSEKKGVLYFCFFSLAETEVNVCTRSAQCMDMGARVRWRNRSVHVQARCSFYPLILVCLRWDSHKK